METNTLLTKINELEKANRQLTDSNRLLEVQNELLDDLLGNINDLIYRYEFLPERKFTYVSPSATRITGYSPEEHYNDPDLGFKLVHPDDRHLLENVSRNNDNPAGTLVLRWIKKDGSIIMTEQSIKYHFDDAGNLVALDGVARTLTNFRLTERLIAETSENNNILNTMFETLSVLSGNGTFLFANKNTALHFTRHDDPAGLIGKNLSEYLPQPQYENLIKIYNEVLTSEKAIKQEIMVSLPLGDRWFINTLQPIEFGISKIKAILSVSLDITEQKLIEEELLANEAKYRELVENSPDAITIHENGIVVYVNKKCLNLYGVAQADDLLGKSVLQFVHPDDREMVINRLKEAIESEAILAPIEERFIINDGSILFVEVIAFPVKFDGRQAVQLIMRDITERKKAAEAIRESELKFRNILENSPFQIWAFNGEIYNYVNKAYIDFTGLETNKPLTADTWTKYVHPEDLEIAEKTWKKALESKAEHDNYFRLRNTAGIYRDFWCHAVPIFDENGNFKQFQGFNIDITERLQAEENLHLHGEIVENMAEGVFLIRTSDGIIVYTNPAIEKIFKAAPGLLNGKHISTVNAPTDRSPDEIAAEIIKSLTTNGTWHGEVKNIRLDGTTFWSYAQVSEYYHSKHGNVWVAIHKDISESKSAEKKLKESESRAQRQREAIATLAINESLFKTDLTEGFDKITEILAKTIEVEIASIWMFSEDGKTLDCISLNESGSQKDPGGLTIDTASIPNYFQAIRTESRIYASDAQNDPRTAELLEKHLIPQGITSMLDAGILIKGKLTGVVCCEHKGEKRVWEADEEAFVSTVASIVAQALINSERMKTKALLLESEQKFREIFNSTNEAIFIGEALNGLIIDCNKRAVEMYGFDNKEELLNSSIGDISANSDHYNELMARHPGRVTIEEGTQTFEWQAKKKNGELFWVEVSLMNTKIGGENRILSVVRDISQRKLAENELFESEKKFRHYFENSSIGKSITAPDGSIQVNHALCQMLGYSKEELESKKWQEVTHPDDIGLTYQQIDLLRTKKEKNVRFEKRYLHKNGAVIYAEVNSFLQFDKQGIALNFFTNINNITAQKQALESLRLSEERNRLLSEVTLEGILIHRKGVAKDLNKSLARIFGYERKELLGRNFLELVHPDDIAVVQEHIVKDYAHPYEVRALKKDGEIFFIEVESKNFHYQDEEWRVTAIRDITERKQQQKEYKQLIDAMNDTAFVINFEGRFVEVNKTAVEVLGYSLDELLTMSVKDIDPHLAGSEIQDLINGMKTDLKQVFETEHQTKTGKIIPVEISSSPVYYQGKEAVLSVARDITQRKHAEQEILRAKELAERSEERFRNYIQSSPTSVFLSDKNGKYTFVNNSVCKLLGYTSEEMLQLSITDITKADNNPDTLKNFEELRKSGEVHDIEKQLIRKDGQVLDVVLDGKRLSENEYIDFVKDISDRKIAEKKLKDQNEEYAILNQQYLQINHQLTYSNNQLQLAKELAEENEIKFRLMYENTSIGIAQISLELKILGANKAYCNMLGYAENELIGKSLQEITHPETVEENIRLQTELFQGLIGSYQLEKRYVHKNGNAIYGLLTSTLIKNSKNEPLYFLGNVQDITERKNAETALMESELFASTVAETTPALLYIYDIEKGKNIWSNNIHKQFFANTKFDSAEFVYEDITQFVHPEDFKILLKLTDEMVNNNEINRFETEIRMKYKGTWKWMQCISAVFKTNNDGNVIQILGVLFDIDDRKKAENDLKESNARFDLAMMASQDGLFDWNLTTNEIYYSPGWKRMLGYEDRELPNDFSIWETLTSPEDVETSWRLQQDLISQKIERFVLEFKMKHKDGHWVEVLSQASAIFDEDGKAIRIVGTHHDITTRKRAEQNLIEAKDRAEESETRFKALHNASFGGIAIHDKGIILDCNNGLTQISGYSQEELIGMNGLMLVHENSRQMVMNNILAEYEKPYEATGIRKNGTEYPVRLEGKMIPYKGKKVRVVEFRDITEQKKAEQEIIKAKERAEENEIKIQQKNKELSERNVFIQTILDNLPIGLSLNYLKEGNATYMNKKFEEIYGWTSPEITSIAEFFERVYPDKNYREQIISRIMADINSGDTTKMHWENIRITSKNGSQKIVNAVNIPLFEQNTMVSTVMDITELYQVQQELIKAKEKAEESDRLKSAFLANMSHEIRTPMNGILGFAELLKEPELTGEEQHKYIAVIEKSGERMLNIINDIIDISKIEAGQVKVELSDTNINDLSEFVCNFFAPEIKKKGLTFTCNIPKNENHLIIKTDREKLYAILTNLVKNAIKYTPKGRIEFGYSVETQNFASLRFYVKDTGIGIPKDRQHAIFDRFVQADIEDIKAMEGAGLGLAISKAYAEMLGGTITVESEQGVGSVFILNLPLQHSERNSSAVTIKNDLKSEVPQTFKDFAVLIAEDEFTSDLYLTEILKAEFKDILHATTGTETVEIIRKNQHIKFILMDIKMPLMNGYDATRMIRTFNKDVIIIAQTAYALSGDREKALDAGCNDYLSKPVKKDLLFSILQHYLTKNANE